jgi:putative CocE/NonD family hydrolase
MPVQTKPVDIQWGVQIPLRDGISLNATLYSPGDSTEPLPVIVTLTPYISQTYHHEAMYFASQRFRFVIVDVRGRGNSSGRFRPFIGERKDGYDVVECLARQAYCNGQVAMWGGSYAGYVQWVTAAERPPHLVSIVPVASPCFGVDFPGRNNQRIPYLMQWLILVWGRTSQERLFWNNESFWGQRFASWFTSGSPLAALDAQFGCPSDVFQEWLDHPRVDEYWDGYNPSPEEYAAVSQPVLTITGVYDDDQPGALAHYRAHLKLASEHTRDNHFLIIGPWDHAGTRDPQRRFAGLEVGDASLIDLRKLHSDWYNWTMGRGARPAFLTSNVLYYVLGRDMWRAAASLEAVTHGFAKLYLSSDANPTDPLHSGYLGWEEPADSGPDEYVHDPRDTSLAELEATVNPESVVDSRMQYASIGRQLYYHSAPFEQDLEIGGFFRMVAWISIDQPDADIRVGVYEIDHVGASVLLATDFIRTRYRESLRFERLIDSTEPRRYEFCNFTFQARFIRRGHRLRLTVGPVHSIYAERNGNTGGVVAREGLASARPVTVRLLHDRTYASILYVPLGGDCNSTGGRFWSSCWPPPASAKPS